MAFSQKSRFFPLALTEYPVFSLLATLLLYELAGQLHPFAFLIAISPHRFFALTCAYQNALLNYNLHLSTDYLFLSFMNVANILLMLLSPGDSLLLWEKRQEEEN